jgi:hypothetical protein
MEIKQQITRLINNLPEDILSEVFDYLKEVEKEAKEKEKLAQEKNNLLKAKQKNDIKK